jgi:molybdopterin converting factor small subunit
MAALPQIAAGLQYDYHHIVAVGRGLSARDEPIESRNVRFAGGMIMQVAVELFGIPRARAGIAQTVATGGNLGDVLADLGNRFPSLAESCIDGRSLRPGFIVNLGAERFVSAPDTPLREGDTVLLLSLDAGG